MSKEPGEMAYAAQGHGLMRWGLIGHIEKMRWSRVESTIRADERAKVKKECEKVAKDYDNGRFVYDCNGDTMESRAGKKIALRIANEVPPKIGESNG